MRVLIRYYQFLLISIFSICLTTPILSYDYVVENFLSIIKKSTEIVEAEVIDIIHSTDEHNIPIVVVT